MRRSLFGLALVALTPGCILASAANRLSDRTYPEQDASIAGVESGHVHVVVRANDGSLERHDHISSSGPGAIGDTKIERAYRRTQAFSPFAIFDPREDENGFELAVTVAGRKAPDRTWIPQVSKAPSTGAKGASYVLMPLGFLVDVATFPIEWLLFPFVAR